MCRFCYTIFIKHVIRTFMILYEHLATYELSPIKVGNDDSCKNLIFIIKLYKEVGTTLIFPNVYRKEIFRLQPTFPQDMAGQPKYEASDELIVIQDDTEDWESIKCQTIEETLMSTVNRIKARVGCAEE